MKKSKYVTFGALLLMTLALSAGFFLPESCAPTPERVGQIQQLVVPLGDLGLELAVEEGQLEPGDALIIGEGLATVVSGADKQTKYVNLARLGLRAGKGLLQEGDRVLIGEGEAIVIPAEDSADSKAAKPAESTAGKPAAEVLPPPGG